MIKIYAVTVWFAGLAWQAGAQQNIGIGTTSPQTRLHIKGTGAGTQIMLEEDGGTVLRMSNEASPVGAYMGTTSNHRFTLVANNQPVMYLTTNGNVGIGLDNPQQRLGIRGGVVVDQDNQNTGTTTNALRFGNNSGEAIGSRRSAGTNQHGLDFYTANTLRMTVVNNGNIGIGTNNPQGLLEIKTGNDRSIKFTHDVVPSMELVSSNANDALAGIMRFRNAIEVMPNAAGTKAGRIDVRNTTGNSTIILDGTNGVISSANAAAFGLKRVFKQVVVTPNGNANETLCEVTVNIPAGGTLYIEGVTNCFFKWNSFWNTIGLELKLDEYSSDNTYISTLVKDEYRDTRDLDNLAVFASLSLPAGGVRKIRFSLFKSGNTHAIGGEFHAIKVWYFPAALQVN
ncbi:MAG: hypothetical protein MUF24_08305 [Chitinophagaceae bacterium]|jgi:hypothetical protein|nr:hypothetical protein [Chitinophagaceae bacterium]